MIFISLGSNERVVTGQPRAWHSISMASIAPHNSDRLMKLGRRKGAAWGALLEIDGIADSRLPIDRGVAART
jgi:hypothetical protein